MGWRIPTIPEVVTSTLCVLWGHDWENGYCINCGAKR